MSHRGIAICAVSLCLLFGCTGDVPKAGRPNPTTTSQTAATGRPTTLSTVAAGGPAPTTVVEPAPPPGDVGSYARWVLGRSGAATVTLDVLEQPTSSPRPVALDHLVSVLRSSAQKPVSVRRAELPAGARSWSDADLVDAAERYGFRGGASDAVLHVLFVNGHDAAGGGDHQVLGVSVRGDVAAVFVDDVDGAGSPLVSPARIEAAVATHELGHLLGLVDLVLDTGRADPEHPGHSTNPGSVMYWAVESDLVSDLLTGGPPQDFDAADRADLARLRGS